MYLSNNTILFKIRLISATVLLTLLGCGQTNNSNTEDKLLVLSGFCVDQADASFCAANEIIQNNCTSCHYHTSWLGYDTSQKWIDSGRVAAGNAEGSALVTKLKNYGGNMPENAPALSDEDAQAIRDWINALQGEAVVVVPPSEFCADPSDVRFCAANEIIQNNCSNCHFHTSWVGYDTSQKWIDSGRVLAGDSSGSILFTKLKNNGGNMPSGAPALSNEDAQAIKDWIDAL